jgi:hypothetical protein
VDDEYVKFKEEEVNTKKMSTILKNLNSPRRRTASSGFSRGIITAGGETNSNRASRTDRSLAGVAGRNIRP